MSLVMNSNVILSWGEKFNQSERTSFITYKTSTIKLRCYLKFQCGIFSEHRDYNETLPVIV